MAAVPKLSNAAALASKNAAAAAVGALLNNGYLRIYSFAQPADADAAYDSGTGTQVLLCELRFAATAVTSTTAGVVTFANIAPATVLAGGDAVWFRALDSGGVDQTDNVFDGNIGETGTVGIDYSLVLDELTLVEGGTVTITNGEFTYTQTQGQG